MLPCKIMTRATVPAFNCHPDEETMATRSTIYHLTYSCLSCLINPDIYPFYDNPVNSAFSLKILSVKTVFELRTVCLAHKKTPRPVVQYNFPQ